jgi:transcriptional regulator GlxA family with amidase domain
MLALLSRLRDGLDQNTPAATVGPPLLRRCEELIETHFARLDFSVEWLAANLGCSPDHLSRSFRRQHGQRLIEAMHDRRIAQARKLLRGSSLGVAEVAWACGYSRPSNFNRMFRERTGTTPRAFAVGKVGADPRP